MQLDILTRTRNSNSSSKFLTRTHEIDRPNDMHELNSLFRRYWDIDEYKETLVARPDEKFARNAVAN